MTAQRSDIVLYNTKKYSLIEIDGPNLFIPENHGIKLKKSKSTNLWKSYHSTYEIKDDYLFLEELGVYTNDPNVGKPVPFQIITIEKTEKINGRERKILQCKTITEPIMNEPPPPPINGVNPKEDRKFDYRYSSLNMKINFTGNLVIGSNFIRELYKHQGNHPSWKYEHIIVLDFKQGQLIGSHTPAAHGMN